MTVLLACIAGGVGAVLRYVLDSLVTARFERRFPWGTFIINVSGSLALGVITSLATAATLSPELRLALGSGLMGGFTTFSTASVQTWELLKERHYGLSAAFGIGMLGAALFAAWAGRMLGSLFVS